MIAIKGHFDGKVIVPDEPVDLPRHRQLIVHIEPAPQPDSAETRIDALQFIADHAIEDESLPADLSFNHHHYLYGTPKRPLPEHE